MSFIQYEAELRSRGSQLRKLHAIIDWEKLERILGKLGRSGYGPQGYEPIKLLKAMLLQSWHSLSDVQLEEALSLRMDFIHFSGFDRAVPDATTICRFRGTLVEQKKARQIFKAINAMFIAHGIVVEPAQKAIVDATIITAAARPMKIIELEPAQEAVSEPIANPEQPKLEATSVRQSADPDARWLKKGKHYFFGYRMHVACDGAGFVHAIHLTPANVSEVTQLEQAIGELRPKRVFADKGYASQANRAMLRGKHIKNGICYKEAGSRPLSHWQRRFNSLVCKSRWRVEQVFGTTKRLFQFTRTRYMGLEKVELEALFKLISYNGLKAIRRCSFDFPGRSLV
jgi:IS5 family transposase